MSKQLNVRGRLDAKSWLLTGGTGFLGKLPICLRAKTPG